VHHFSLLFSLLGEEQAKPLFHAYEEVRRMKVGTVFVVVSFICFFLTVYFAMLPQYVSVDGHLKRQLLALATSFFVGGMVLILFFAIIKISGKVTSNESICFRERPHF